MSNTVARLEGGREDSRERFDEVRQRRRDGRVTSSWLGRHVGRIERDGSNTVPLITAGDVRSMIDGCDVWDMWPLALPDGSPAPVSGGTLWMFLAAPRHDDPGLRHDHARIWLFLRRDARWIDCGPLLPEGFSPGSREWSGSAVLDPETGEATLFFTAAGRREGGPRFEQRLFQTRGRLDVDSERPRLVGWSAPTESVAADDEIYRRTATAEAAPGLIKGFRDPGYFRDPADGASYLLFTASRAGSRHSYDGVIGVARATGADGLGGWRLEPPLIDADGLCNEMERPHIILRDGLYYLFWSSQASVFSPGGPAGLTGLYGAVSESFRGEWRPLNGSGLVLANPPMAPAQAYCWWVTPDLSVISFVDQWRTGEAPDATAFGGTAAPLLRLTLDGDRSSLV